MTRKITKNRNKTVPLRSPRSLRNDPFVNCTL
jgi:hypothetical protein